MDVLDTYKKFQRNRPNSGREINSPLSARNFGLWAYISETGQQIFLQNGIF